MSATGDSETGSTLLEMLVVVGIMGLIAGQVFPDFFRPLQSIQLNQARTGLLVALRTAHASAIRRGQAVQFEIFDGGSSYGWEQTKVTLRPPLRIDAEPPGMSFFADGTAAGGALSIADGRRSVRIVVDAGGTVAAQ